MPSRFEVRLAGRKHPPRVEGTDKYVGVPLAVARDVVGFAAPGEVTAFGTDGKEQWTWTLPARPDGHGKKRLPVFGSGGDGRVVAWWPASGHVAIRAPDGKVSELRAIAVEKAEGATLVPSGGRLWLRDGSDASGPGAWFGSIDPATATAPREPLAPPGVPKLESGEPSTGIPPRVRDADGCLRGELLGAGWVPTSVHGGTAVGDAMVVRADVLVPAGGPPAMARVWVWRLP